MMINGTPITSGPTARFVKKKAAASPRRVRFLRTYSRPAQESRIKERDG